MKPSSCASVQVGASRPSRRHGSAGGKPGGGWGAAGGRLGLGLLVALAAAPARAGDLSGEPVGGRISFAKDRILIFTDQVARQAGAAYPGPSATNPASDDFSRAEPLNFNGYGLFITSDLFFEHGGAVTGAAGIGSVRLPEKGTLSLSYVRLDSHHGTSRQDDHFGLHSNEVIVGYSRSLAEFLSVGLDVQVTDGLLTIDDRFAGFPRHTRSETLGAGFEAGMLLALSRTFTVGLHGGMKWDGTETTGAVRLPGTAVPIDLDDTSETARVRAGVGWRPDPRWGFYADGQYARYEDMFGSMDVGRFFAGAEFVPNPHWALRLGTVVDTQPQAGVAAGVGYYGFKGVPIELAYAFNTFPEVRREFGRAHTVSLSVIFLF